MHKRIIERIQEDARNGDASEILTQRLDLLDPDNKIPGEAIDLLIEWTANRYRDWITDILDHNNIP